MKTILICCLIIGAVVKSSGQRVDWDSTTNWKLYQANSDLGGHFDPESKDTTHFITLQSDSVDYYLTGALLLPSEHAQGIYWMGDFFASCRMGTHNKLLRLSRYGGFFVDLETNTYFEIPIEKRSRWHSFLVNEFMRMSSK